MFKMFERIVEFREQALLWIIWFAMCIKSIEFLSMFITNDILIPLLSNNICLLL